MACGMCRASGSFPVVEKIFALALVEYTMDIDLPDFIFEDPLVIEMSDAIFDLSIWANVRGSTYVYTISPN